MCFTKKGVITGIVAGITFEILGFLMMFGFPAQNEWYSQIFSDMMTTSGMLTTIISGFVVAFFAGAFYDTVNKVVKGKGWKKGAMYGLAIWVLAGTMWPIMMLSFAPMNILVTEWVLNIITYVLVGIVIATVHKKL